MSISSFNQPNRPGKLTANRMAVTKIQRNGREFTALISLDENRNFTELSVYEPEEDSLLDQIRIARVEKVVPGIQAAFVRISSDQKAYLPLEYLDDALFTKKQSANKPISEGDELVVQITKDAVKTKDPVASAKLTLAGRYAILISGEGNWGISKKIKGEERKELQEFLIQYKESQYYNNKNNNKACSVAEDNSEIIMEVDGIFPDEKKLESTSSYSILLRTNSLQASHEELTEDLDALIKRWNMLYSTAPHKCAFSLLEAPIPGFIRGMQSIAYDKIERVLTDDPGLFAAISDFLPYLTEQGKLELYKDTQVSLFVLYNIEGNINTLLGKRVWLPGGGNLIIEQLETMTVIDVNSAKGTAGRSSTHTTNCEAAAEIPRQLRLRNISGMILVDFINSDHQEEEEQFLTILKHELRQDPVPAQFIDITKLGLVEITRKKVRKSLQETINGKTE